MMYVPFYFISPLMSCFVKCSEHAGALITRLCELQRMRICWGGRPAWPEAGAMQGTIGTGQPGNSGDISPGQPHSLELWAELCEPGSKAERC